MYKIAQNVGIFFSLFEVIFVKDVVQYYLKAVAFIRFYSFCIFVEMSTFHL